MSMPNLPSGLPPHIAQDTINRFHNPVELGALPNSSPGFGTDVPPPIPPWAKAVWIVAALLFAVLFLVFLMMLG